MNRRKKVRLNYPKLILAIIALILFVSGIVILFSVATKTDSSLPE